MSKMRFFLLIATVMLTSCNIGDIAFPTTFPVPDIELDDNPVETPQPVAVPDESPRQGPAINLPPTWTPVSNAGFETPVPAPNQPTDAEVQSYIVQVGDTLAGIAIQFGVSLDDLAQINNITDRDHVEVGQELIIPSR